MSNFKLWLILGVVLFIILYIVYKKNFKRLVTNAVALVTGAPKTGKTLVCLYLSQKEFKKRHRKWWFATKILRIKNLEEPMYYTNTAVSFGNLKRKLKGKKPHRLDRCIVKIKLEHLMREFRFNYKSVIFISESSLLADNQDIRNQQRNAELSMFNKLIAHETRGGCMFYDTQNSLDNHYAIKRICSTFFFISKSLNLFFFRVLYVRELVAEDIGSNNFIDDVDETTRKVLIFRWWYKKYDRYYYSYLTDKLDTANELPSWYKDGLDSFNPLYRQLSKKGGNVNEVKDFKEDVKASADIKHKSNRFRIFFSRIFKKRKHKTIRK